MINHNRIADKPLLIMHLKGSQREMGAQYGEIIKQHGGIAEMAEFYPAMVKGMILSAVPRRMRRGILPRALSPLLEASASALNLYRPDDFRERTNAALDAAGHDRRKSKYFKIMDLFQNTLGLVGTMGVLPNARSVMGIPACSSAVVWDDASANGELMHARNFDFPGVGIWDEAPVVVFCTPNEGIPYGYISTRGAEVPGISAFNEAGLTITAHTRLHKNVNISGMGIVDYCHDIIRKANTIDEAISIARRRLPCSTWGIVVTSGKEHRAVILETTASKLRVIEPRKNYLLNTNHYLDPELQKGELATSTGWSAHTHDRMRYLQHFIDGRAKAGGASLDDLEHMLGRCNEIDAIEQDRSMGSVLGHVTSVASMILRPEIGSIRLSVGKAPTGWGPYLDIPLKWKKEAGVEVVTCSEQDLTQPEHAFTSGSKYEAYRAFQQSYLLDMQFGEYGEVRDSIEKAVSLDPADTAYRFVAGVVSLEESNHADAMQHFEAGLQHEQSPYRRGQFQLWGARTASAMGNEPLAASLRSELMANDNPYLGQLKEAAQKKSGLLDRITPKAVIPNFMLIDAA